jgi:hypothetical protein
MKKLLVCLLSITLLVACTPKPEQIAPYVEQTLSAWPTQTPYSTATNYPTYTPLPTYTDVPTLAPIVITVTPSSTLTLSENEELQKVISDGVISLLETLELVESINTIRWNGSSLELEAKLPYASADNLIPLHYEIVRYISLFFDDTVDSKFLPVFNDDTKLIFVSLPAMGSKQYISTTNLETMRNLNDKTITFDEWKTVANFIVK